ncbi:MAG: TRAP transporter large permease subunit, partial [Lachnospiraceae bacterium]|nr:TRAP transporter large permease subunit [Lachnospiraceae bacterium]
MSKELIGVIAIILLFVLLAGRVWVGLAMSIAGFVAIFALKGFTQAWTTLFGASFSNVCNYSLSVMPMFVLMGCIISETDIGSDLYKTMHKWLGNHKGGLAYATVAATGLLGAITGSQLTGAIVMSKVALPEMEKVNYKDTLSTGSIAAASPLGILIPPSTAFVLYGLLTEQSIGKLFISGIIPGVITVIVFFVVIFIICRRDPELGPKMGYKVPLKERMQALVKVLPILILFALVMVGIYAGLCTATEAGALGAFAALIITIVTKQMTVKKFMNSLKETANLMGMIMLQMMGTYIFSTALTYTGVTTALGRFVIGLNVPKFVIIIAIIILYLILGCFLPEFPMIMLTVPILYPFIQQLGFYLIWFVVLFYA